MVGTFLKELTEDNSTQEIEHGGNGIKILKFGAGWCGPCRTMAPIVEEVASEYKDDTRITFYSIDVDNPKCEKLSGEHAISSIPAIVAIKNNKVIEKKTGSMNKSSFAEWIKNLINNNF